MGKVNSLSRYVNIAIRIWHDERFRELPDDAKVLFLYLLTSPHGNMCGLFYLPPLYACHDMGWTEKRYQASIEQLKKQGIVAVDGDTMLIKNFLRYNPINGPKQAIGAANRLKEVPDTVLVECFLKILQQNTEPEDYQKFIDTYGIPYRYPIDTPPIPDTDTDTESETGTESETETEEKQSRTPHQEIVERYHKNCSSLPRLKVVTDKRKDMMRVRWKTYGDLVIYEELFQKAEASDFLSGRSGKWTGCNFDWLLNETNMVKVLEGNYDNRKGTDSIDSWAAKREKMKAGDL